MAIENSSLLHDATWLNLPSLNLTVKSLYTGYLLAVG